MTNKNDTSEVFLDGCIIEKDTFLFSTRLDALAEGDYDHGRLSAFRHGQWFYWDRKHQVVSICVKRETESEPNRASFVLERMSGKIGAYWKGEQGSRDELLPGKEGSFGPMIQLIQVDGVLYACGVDASVYKRQYDGWMRFNEGLNAKTLVDYQAEGHSFSDALSLHMANQDHISSIGGVGSVLFLCGMKGLLCYRLGDTWQRMESPTNANLTRIKCINENTVYITGENGFLLKGNEKGFRAISSEINDDFTCLEWFNEKLYVGGYKGIYVLDGNVLHRVNTNQNGHFHCVTLDAHDGQLIAVSERWFLVFDGNDWKRIDDPDNADILNKKP